MSLLTLHMIYPSFRKQIIVNLSLPIQTITILILLEKLEVTLFQLFAQSEIVIKWRKVDWTKVLSDIKSHVFFLYHIALQRMLLFGGKFYLVFDFTFTQDKFN